MSFLGMVLGFSDRNLQYGRAVVRMAHVGQQPGVFQQRARRFGRHRVVDPPAFVVRPRVGAETPTGLLIRFVVEQPERVDEAAVQEAAHPFAFFGQETAARGIAHRVVDVDRPVADVVVAAQDQLRPLFYEFRYVSLKIFEPLHFERLALVA